MENNYASHLFVRKVQPDEYYEFIETIDSSLKVGRKPDCNAKTLFLQGSLVTLIFVEVNEEHYQIIVPKIDGLILQRLASDIPPEQLLAVIETLYYSATD